MWYFPHSDVLCSLLFLSLWVLCWYRVFLGRCSTILNLQCPDSKLNEKTDETSLQETDKGWRFHSGTLCTLLLNLTTNFFNIIYLKPFSGQTAVSCLDFLSPQRATVSLTAATELLLCSLVLSSKCHDKSFCCFSSQH